MTHKISIVLLIICVFSCRSWTEDIKQKPEPLHALFEISELVLESTVCDTIVELTDLADAPHCFLRSICDDKYGGIDTTTLTYEFGNIRDTVQSEWFSIVRDSNILFINVQPNDSTAFRQFRILYTIMPDHYAFIVTQKGNEYSSKTKLNMNDILEH